MKNYETTGKTEYYALIRAKDIESAKEIYCEEVALNEDEPVEFLDFKEVSDEYVMQQHRNLDDGQFADGEMEAVLEEAEKILNNDDLVGYGTVMLIDSDLI